MPYARPTQRLARRRGLLAAAAVHLALTIPLAALCSVDVDEAYSLATSGLPFGHVLHRALTFELQPPLYFLALHAWRVVDGGVFWARLLSVACAAGVVLLAPGVIRRFVPSVPGAVAAALLAVNPVLVWAAITARGYAAIALLSTLLLGLAHRAFLGDAPRARAAIAYGVTAAAALHTQYYLGFLLAGLGLALVAAGRWRAVGAYALCMLAVAALSTPLFLYTGAQMAAHTTAGAKPGLAGSVAEAARHAESLVLSMHAVSFGRAGRWVARLLFWGAAAWSVAGALRTRASLANVGVLAGVAATMVAGYGVARSLTSVEAMSMRHTVALLVPALALTLALLTARPGAARTLAVGALVAVVMSADALWLDYRDLDSNPPHKAIVAWVEARPDLRPEQPLLVFPAESALALPYHVTVPNRVVPLPVPPSLTVYDPRSDAITSEAALEAAVAPAIGPSGEAWLLWYSQRSFLGVDLGSAVLERWLDRAFDVVEQADLEDCRVLHLRRRAGPR